VADEMEEVEVEVVLVVLVVVLMHRYHCNFHQN
jgi:hypothetical protein